MLAERKIVRALAVWLALIAGLLVNQLVLALEPGDPAPGLSLPSLVGGHTVNLSDYKGSLVYVDFWASWCSPCRQSLPLYETLYQEFSGKDFQILAINLDEFEEDAVSFLARHPVSYTVLRDASGDTPERWQIKAMPSSFLLDGSARVIDSWAGFEPGHIEEIRHAIIDFQSD